MCAVDNAVPVEFDAAGESEAIAALIAGKARVNTQHISPSLPFITEINLSFVSITRSGIPQNGLLDTTLFWFMSCIKYLFSEN
jgi:hypothetical protein